MQPLFFKCGAAPRVIEDDCLNNALFVSLYWELCGSVGSWWITIFQPRSRRLISLLRQATVPFFVFFFFTPTSLNSSLSGMTLRLHCDCNQIKAAMLHQQRFGGSAAYLLLLLPRRAATIIGHSNARRFTAVVLSLSSVATTMHVCQFFLCLVRDAYKLHSAVVGGFSPALLHPVYMR